MSSQSSKDRAKRALKDLAATEQVAVLNTLDRELTADENNLKRIAEEVVIKAQERSSSHKKSCKKYRQNNDIKEQRLCRADVASYFIPSCVMDINNFNRIHQYFLAHLPLYQSPHGNLLKVKVFPSHVDIQRSKGRHLAQGVLFSDMTVEGKGGRNHQNLERKRLALAECLREEMKKFVIWIQSDNPLHVFVYFSVHICDSDNEECAELQTTFAVDEFKYHLPRKDWPFTCIVPVLSPCLMLYDVCGEGKFEEAKVHEISTQWCSIFSANTLHAGGSNQHNTPQYTVHLKFATTADVLTQYVTY
jgi:hypothetical protein